MASDLKTNIRASIMQKLEDAGFRTFFVGGCVRDELSGETPHDYDLVTEAKPDDIKRILKNLQLVDIRSERFGIVVVRLNDVNVEIATFRTDKKCDGRKAEVELL